MKHSLTTLAALALFTPLVLGWTAPVLSAIGTGKAKFLRYRDAIPSNFDVVAGGGWNEVYKMAADPKAELVSMIASSLKGEEGDVSGTAAQSDKLEALVALLESQGKGFSSDVVEGEWAIVLSRQARKSPKLQKVLGRKTKALKAFANFHTSEMKFINESYTRRGNGRLEAVVKYGVSPKAFTKSADGKIVLRRVMCDIVDASYKYWKLPRLPLPIRATGGYLDFVYLDEDIRVTRGNRGGLFIHFRPEYLKKVLDN